MSKILPPPPSRLRLQIQLARGLIHFARELNGTGQFGKSSLKAIYATNGYECLTKVDRDYKTVNRYINLIAKLYEKLGPSLIKVCIKDLSETEAIERVIAQFDLHNFLKWDDVADLVGADSNRTRKLRSL